MMRWNKGDAGFENKNLVVTEVASEDDEQMGPGLLLGHVVNMLAATLARFGVSSVAVALTMALLIATVLFTVFTGDAAALGQWCRKC
jgi:hypothetical protein